MFFWNRKRKSRKQLLQEIEELKAAKNEYLDKWMDKCDSYNYVFKQIKTIKAACLSVHEERNDSVERCLCMELAKEIMPYVSYEKYEMVGEPWIGEFKHIATIKIVDK